MPNSTFLNLPAEKQEKLLAAATREFLKRPFNEASINQIVKEAGISRGSFYMYFRDKEELFRYLLQGHVGQMVALIEELLVSAGGDIFDAMVAMYDYIHRHAAAQELGELGVLCGFIRRNSGLQKSSVMEMVDPNIILTRLAGSVNPDLLDLRRERDLWDMLHILLSIALPTIYTSLQENAPDARDYLQNTMSILRRGMSRIPADHEK